MDASLLDSSAGSAQLTGNLNQTVGWPEPEVVTSLGQGYGQRVAQSRERSRLGINAGTHSGTRKPAAGREAFTRQCRNVRWRNWRELLAQSDGGLRPSGGYDLRPTSLNFCRLHTQGLMST